MHIYLEFLFQPVNYFDKFLNKDNDSLYTPPDFYTWQGYIYFNSKKATYIHIHTFVVLHIHTDIYNICTNVGDNCSLECLLSIVDII
jgi:hypothetical protein